MTPWTLLISLDVIQFIETLPRSERFSLRNRFIAIRDYPANHSDYREADISGRSLDINIFGKFAIKYWADGIDGHVKILDVHWADRRSSSGSP